MDILEPKDWRRFCHDSVNLLDALALNCGVVWPRKLEQGTLTPDQFAAITRSVAACRKAMQDISTLLQCESETEATPEPMDWKTMLEQRLSAVRRKPELFQSELSIAPLPGSGCPVLIDRVVGCLAWLTENFCRTPASVQLGQIICKGIPWVVLSWRADFLQELVLKSEFAEFQPFYPLNPKSMALEETTGLSLRVIRRVAEVHQGRLTSKSDRRLELEFSCPQTFSYTEDIR